MCPLFAGSKQRPALLYEDLLLWVTKSTGNDQKLVSFAYLLLQKLLFRHKENNHEESSINQCKNPSESPWGIPLFYRKSMEDKQRSFHCKIHAILQEKGRTNFLFVFKKRQKSLNLMQIASKIH